MFNSKFNSLNFNSFYKKYELIEASNDLEHISLIIPKAEVLPVFLNFFYNFGLIFILFVVIGLVSLYIFMSGLIYFEYILKPSKKFPNFYEIFAYNSSVMHAYYASNSTNFPFQLNSIRLVFVMLAFTMFFVSNIVGSVIIQVLSTQKYYDDIDTLHELFYHFKDNQNKELQFFVTNDDMQLLKIFYLYNNHSIISKLYNKNLKVLTEYRFYRQSLIDRSPTMRYNVYILRSTSARLFMKSPINLRSSKKLYHLMAEHVISAVPLCYLADT